MRWFNPAVLLLGAALAVPVAPPAQAASVDRRPCVSAREWASAMGRLPAQHETRHALETRWEVKGLGVPGELIYPVTAYPRCGFSLTDGWVGAMYRKAGDRTVVVHIVTCETPHGQQGLTCGGFLEGPA